jgi:hypothetical protein
MFTRTTVTDLIAPEESSSAVFALTHLIVGEIFADSLLKVDIPFWNLPGWLTGTKANHDIDINTIIYKFLSLSRFFLDQNL